MSEDSQLAALEALYDLELDAFVRTAAAITGERESGRDAVNDAFAGAIRHRRQFRGEGTLEAWVWRVVVREALKTRRRSGRRLQRTRQHPGVDERASRSDVRAAGRRSRCFQSGSA
jgi:DNA-directed RNA polymerase specialized sigma24 family protein